MPVRRWIQIIMLVTVALTAPATAQLPSLKKLKDAAKKVAKPVDTVKAKPADSVPPVPPPAPAAAPAASPSPAPAATSAQPPAAAQATPKIWENYDFVPGNKVLFYTDFSDDVVGNFARGLKYQKGPAEVVELDGVKVLRTTGPAQFFIPLPKRLPARFTLEIDVIAPASGILTRAVSFEGGAKWSEDPQSASVSWNPRTAFIQGGGHNLSTSSAAIPAAMHPLLIGKLAHLRLLMDSSYFKMYVNERRLYNIPEVAFRRDSVIRMSIEGSEAENGATFIASIRIAESETNVLYDALAAKGRWSTHGILFATGKAELQPESRPVLKEIAATLKGHAELKVLIEGHTDNVGTPAANLALSNARAAAVKDALVADFGIGAERITTKGLGDTKPSVPNTTAAGKAQNRRVEVVKQ